MKQNQNLNHRLIESLAAQKHPVSHIIVPKKIKFKSSSYKPAPLDLSAIELNAKTEELVDRLSENTHNVWARERISQVNM